MASTSLKNSSGVYSAWKASSSSAYARNTLPAHVRHTVPAHPGLGIGGRRAPTGDLGEAADIESSLRGLGSSSLERQPLHVPPVSNVLPFLDAYSAPPTLLPDPLVVQPSPRTIVFGST
jgi:hypothetical protein